MRKPMLTQYKVHLPEKPGVRARITRYLAKRGIDLASLVAARVAGRTAIQFLAPRNDELRDALERMDCEVREDLIFQVELPRHPWELHKLARALAERRINIHSLYSTMTGGRMRIVLSVDEPANAVALLEKLGYRADYSVFER